MFKPFKRKPKPAQEEYLRLLKQLSHLAPDTDQYQTVLARLNDLDRILNRASETKKAVIPALGTIGAIGGVYAIQQFGGILVPKAMEQIAARQEQKKSPKDD